MRYKSALLGAILLANTVCVGFGPAVLTNADVPTSVVAPEQIQLPVGVPCPELTAAAWILVDEPTGQILCANNEHEQRAQASLVKLATALVALERGNLDDKLTVAWADLTVGTSVPIVQNEEYSLYELLVALLMASDNAAGVTIARSLAGDETLFVEWMNEFVSGLGLQDTHYANAHGLDEDGGYSSAYDTAILTRYAMQNEIFAGIVAKQNAAVGDYLAFTTNELFTEYPGVIGVKTGTTDNAGDCLVAMVDRAQGRALTVVLGSEDRYADTRQLLDYYYGSYAELDVSLAVNDLNRYQDEYGEWHTLYTQDEAILLLPVTKVRDIKIFRNLTNPIPNPNSTTPVGTLDVYLGGELYMQVPMYAHQ